MRRKAVIIVSTIIGVITVIGIVRKLMILGIRHI